MNHIKHVFLPYIMNNSSCCCCCCCLSFLSCSDGRVNFLPILPPNARWWSTIAATITGADTDNMRVNCTRNTVRDLQIEFGESILLVYGGRTNIRDGSRFHHVPHGEALDGLILGDASSAVRAADKLNVTTSVLVAPSISSFRSHVGL